MIKILLIPVIVGGAYLYKKMIEKMMFNIDNFSHREIICSASARQARNICYTRFGGWKCADCDNANCQSIYKRR
jgi:uncharacterized protein (UPF0333 family)